MVKDASTIHGAKRIALRDPNVTGNPVLAIMDVEKVEAFSDADMKMMTEKIFRTLDPERGWNKVIMMRDGKGHAKEDWVILSGTKVREMLSKGIAPPPEFSRPGAARFLSSLSAAAPSSAPGCR